MYYGYPPRVSTGRIATHTLLVFVTGGLWLIPLVVRRLLSFS